MSIFVIDKPVTAQTIITEIDLGGPTPGNGLGPLGIGVNSTTNRIYVANRDTGNVSVIDGTTNEVIDSIVVGGDPFGVGVNQTTNRIDGRRLSKVSMIYVTNRENVSVIDGATNQVIDTITVGHLPEEVGVNPTTNRIYVTSGTVFGTSIVSVIDGATNQVIDTVS